MLGDVLRNWSFKGEDFRIGVVAGIFVIIACLLAASGGEVNIKSLNADNYDFAYEPGRVLLGFPTFADPSEFKFAITNLSVECIDTKIEINNGIQRNGWYCEGDSIYAGNRILTIDKIWKSENIKNPIHITVRQITHLGGFFKVLLFILPLIAIFMKINTILRRREAREKADRKVKLAKKLKIKEKDLDELTKFIEDEQE